MASKLYLISMLAFAGLLAAGCGTTSRMGGDPGGSGRTAAVAGGKAIESGVASWYGPNFHGKLTANGEEYDMHALTAAHRTLPFNTIVRVENQENGRSVDVRINDRGPFAKNRIIDLSRRAAEEIEMIGPGTAPVRLYIVQGDLANSKTTDLKVATYTVQLGSFRDEASAFELSRKVDGSRVEEFNLNNGKVFRVYYGIFIERNEAERKQRELESEGFNGYVKQIQND